MSKKTENINQGIKALENIQMQLQKFAEENNNRQMSDLSFEMNQQLKNLKFWQESLYSYNGKSKSRAKQTASKENGKKGGRPPKEISLSKTRHKELEILIEEMNHNLKMSDNIEEINHFEKELEVAREEYKQLDEKLTEWKVLKKNKEKNNEKL